MFRLLTKIEYLIHFIVFIAERLREGNQVWQFSNSVKIPVKNPSNFRQPGPGSRFLANFVPGPGLDRDPGRSLLVIHGVCRPTVVESLSLMSKLLLFISRKFWNFSQNSGSFRGELSPRLATWLTSSGYR